MTLIVGISRDNKKKKNFIKQNTEGNIVKDFVCLLQILHTTHII